MKITVMGAGYVGLVTGACFAELGNHVTCVDVDRNKITQLQKGTLPFYEPGLEPMVVSNLHEGRLHFSYSLAECAADSQVIFIAVGTPSDKDGSADIKYVLEAARSIGAYLNQYAVIVDKSTVPVGMADQVQHVIQQALQERDVKLHFDVVSNPEFLREGAAIEDFMRPDRIIIGLGSDSAKRIMLDLYLPILRGLERPSTSLACAYNIFFMSVKEAEMTKYVANAMLAARISFMNEMALLCEQLSVDIEKVRIGVGSDSRIGPMFLNPGCGYGGSCFPKDVRALIKMAEQHGVEPAILRAVEQRNLHQKQVLSEKIFQRFGQDLSGMTLAVWGLSFKPGTDDMREAPSLVLIENVLQRGACIQAYDPAAIPLARTILPNEWMEQGKLTFADHQYEALKDADALALVTEWKPFCYPDVAAMKSLMRKPIVFDGRNQYDPQQMQAAGFEYYGVGRAGTGPNVVCTTAREKAEIT